MNVIREKNKKVNVLDLIKPAENKKALSNFRIELTNVSGTYFDFRGWGKNPYIF